jgi:hypothetical protein
MPSTHARHHPLSTRHPTFPVDQSLIRAEPAHMKSKKDLLEMQFIEIRHLVVELAAFLDRIDRSPGEPDFRVDALHNAIRILSESSSSRARTILDSLSDPSSLATESKAGPPACGAPMPSA